MADLAGVEPCPELTGLRPAEPQTPEGCTGCLAEGRSDWVAIRLCLDCGHVGCCDSSPAQHATGHFRSTGHPVVHSYEPGDTWAWCYVHTQMLPEVDPAILRAHP